MLGLIDYEANFCVVTAYQHTSVTSVQVNICSSLSSEKNSKLKLLDSSTIIFVLILSYFILKRRFSLIHLFFVLLVFVGLGLMIWSDVRSSDSSEIGAKWLGCLLVIVGCMMYAISNVALEKIVNERPFANVEYLSQLSMWALIFSSIQMAILERDSLIELGQNEHPAAVTGWLICFTASLFTVYSLMPVAFGLSSAVFVNLGLLTG